MADISSIFNTIKSGITSLAETSLKNYASQAESAVQALLGSLESNIEKWTTDVVSGDMSTAELADLVGGQSALVEITALTQAGLAQIQADEFRQGVIDIVVKAVSTAI